MKKQINYPKTQQFRDVVSTIKNQASFMGMDDDGEPIYDPSAKMPTLTFNGTVKIHGTNSAVCYNNIDGFWIQSRNRIIEPTNDNLGFAFFANNLKEELTEMIKMVAIDEEIDLDLATVTVYGEWAGKGIQKGVGISEIDRAFFIFGVKVSEINDDEAAYWIDADGLRYEEGRVFNVSDYQSYTIKIDFNDPQAIQNKLIEITQEVENQCPISKALGIDGVGEGVVWSCTYKNAVYRFKVKGEKHSSSKVKKLASVDTDKLNSINEFVEYAVTESRFNQGINEVFQESDWDIKKLGEFLKWMMHDIISEESDTMKDNGLEPKDVSRKVSDKARGMFFDKYNTV